MHCELTMIFSFDSFDELYERTTATRARPCRSDRGRCTLKGPNRGARRIELICSGLGRFLVQFPVEKSTKTDTLKPLHC